LAGRALILSMRSSFMKSEPIIAVFAGGTSSEREVSLSSGRASA